MLNLLVVEDNERLRPALAAGICAVFVVGLPFKLGLLAATGLGIAVGLALEARRTAQQEVPA